MTKKQKKMRLRIIISLVLFVILFVCEHMGVLEPLPWWAQLLIFAVPYLIVGYDIIFKLREIFPMDRFLMKTF